VKWMQWALNGSGMVDLASTFHLNGMDHKQIYNITIVKDLKFELS
jgi:hypothetical protein